MESRQVGDVTVISPRGFINAHTVRQFEQSLSQALEDGHEKISSMAPASLISLAQDLA